jgi:D-glycero-alpha-D-manno-heptose-7-phosphate kinase
MIVRSRAPLRLGLAGGGTDLPAFSDRYGGSVLNATVNYYAHCTIKSNTENKIIFSATDLKILDDINIEDEINLKGLLPLHRATYKKFIEKFELKPESVTVSSFSDVPPGSGLGSSSTLVVAIIKAFSEWFEIPLGDYDIAKLAYEIERIDLNLSGGKQDQYAASFGGFNFMEFQNDGNVIINPLQIKNEIIDELSEHIILYYSGMSRSAAEISDGIIEEQNKNVDEKLNHSLEAMKITKQISYDMKDALIKGDILEMGKLMNYSWEQKKLTAKNVSNSELDKIFKLAIANKAISCKLSGAGGGGFSIFLVDPLNRHDFISFLQSFSKGFILNVNFSLIGCKSWRV